MERKTTFSESSQSAKYPLLNTVSSFLVKHFFFFFSMQATLPLVIGQFPFVGCFWLRDYLTVADVMDMNLSKLREMVRDWKAWCAAAHEVEKSWTCLGD